MSNSKLTISDKDAEIDPDHLPLETSKAEEIK